ncbi:MAG: PmoA family protein [Phycisphaerales bacterium]|nr:MAG: PmoA family protein [Phycisphaerales bacterium]
MKSVGEKLRWRQIVFALGVILSVSVAVRSGFCAEPLATITVEAGEHARIDTPVSMPLAAVPEAARGAAFHLEEVTGTGRMSVPAQVEPGVVPRLWWILSGTTAAGKTRTYELLKGAKGRGVDVTRTDKFLDVKVGENKVLRYNHAIVPAPEGQDRLYDRGAFIHPLWSPAGTVLTNIQPKDHYHHVGIWMPWTKTKFEGKEVDFWNLKAGQGTVRFVKFLSETSGPVYGGFEAKQEHVALQTSEGEKVVLDEVWDVRVYNIGGPDKGYWLWDFKSTQRCVADSPLYQEEYRYGGFGYRAAAEWDEENAAYLTSEGKTRKNGHATRARWCDMAGEINGTWEGVTMYSHPKNFRHPEPMRIWPEGQVFFNFAPSQAGDWVMEPGVDHVFRYRVYVHGGKIEVADAERIWHDYAAPPEVQVKFSRPKTATVLFGGTGFSKWEGQGGGQIKWKQIGDAMQIVPKSGSIMTKDAYRDFILHAEFKTPQLPPHVKGQGRGNSGIYIQRRYEVQILDSYGLEPKNNECGSLYKTKAPDRNVCKKPGEWQSYDIMFRAARFDGAGGNAKKVENARITIYHNGVLIHDDAELANKTGAGRPEGPGPGPILLQDHGNEVSFRNIWIVPM